MNFNDIATIPIKLDEAFFFKLPKTDIHVHLDGSLRPSTILELADKQGIDIGASTIEELKNKIGAGKIHNSLNEYLKGFEITLKVLQTQDALYRTAYELPSMQLLKMYAIWK
jgi:adenosine deaminase